jgi:hypothetical protein
MTVDRFIPAQDLPLFSFGQPQRCTYCGTYDPNGRDHVIPVSMQHVHDEHRWTINGPWTYCCQSCNSILSNHLFDSFLDRCRHVAGRLAERVKPVMWHQWELIRMDYSLRKYIQAQIASRILMHSRADWFESREFYCNIENLKWEFSEKVKPRTFLYSFFSETVREIGHTLYLRS